MGEWRYSSIILELRTRWKWVVSFTPRPLYPLYPVNRRLGEPQSRSGPYGVEKNILPLPRIEPRPTSPSPSLYQLSYPGSKKNTIQKYDSIENCILRFLNVGSFLVRERDISFQHRAQRGSGNCLDSKTVGTRENGPGYEADNSSPSSTMVRMKGIYPGSIMFPHGVVLRHWNNLIYYVHLICKLHVYKHNVQNNS
jgi:hypothetical protein